MTADASPLSSAWVTPRDAFVALARASRRSPEAVALGEAVGEALGEYLAGAITLREFARRHTPYERFRAVRVWGPDDPRFAAIMPVLDDLIALHRAGKAGPAPRTAGEAVRRNLPVAAQSGRGFACAVCGGPMFAVEGRPLVCRACREHGVAD